jgi:hypothetical protein
MLLLMHEIIEIQLLSQAKRAANVFPAAAQDILLLPGQVCMSRSSRHWMIKLEASSCR